MDAIDAHTSPLRALGALYADDDPDQAIAAGAVYTLIRLALVKRDHGHRAAHAVEASALHVQLAAAYLLTGAPIGEHGGSVRTQNTRY